LVCERGVHECGGGRDLIAQDYGSRRRVTVVAMRRI
jgi:hypothetical protein